MFLSWPLLTGFDALPRLRDALLFSLGCHGNGFYRLSPGRRPGFSVFHCRVLRSHLTAQKLGVTVGWFFSS